MASLVSGFNQVVNLQYVIGVGGSRNWLYSVTNSIDEWPTASFPASTFTVSEEWMK